MSPNKLLAAGVLYALTTASTSTFAASPQPQQEYTEPVQAHYRGCETPGWCRFWIESLDPLAQSLHRVYPDGVPRSADNVAISIKIRDRLNALLANMVHQYKRIVLHDLREVEDGAFAATVTVHGTDLAEDSALQELRGELAGTTSQPRTRSSSP